MAQAQEDDAPGRLQQLKRLAEEDCQDEYQIAEARKRIKLRDVERVCLQQVSASDGSLRLTTHTPDAEDAEDTKVKEQSEGAGAAEISEMNLAFDDFLERCKDAFLNHESAQNNLECPRCSMLPPDDPVLTSCFCLYCMECFTEMVATASRKRAAESISCLGHAHEHVEAYLVLSHDRLGQLLQVWGLRKVSSPDGTGFRMGPEDLPEDLDTLWRSRKAAGAAAELAGDHSRLSPALGEESIDLDELSSDTDGELASDGFSDLEHRSVGYETDLEAEDDRVFVTSDCGNPIYPRQVALSSESGESEEETKDCLNEVGSSELRELQQDTVNILKALTSTEEQLEQRINRDDQDDGVPAGLLIDLTEEGSVVGPREPVELDNESSSGVSDEIADEATECSCRVCGEQQAIVISRRE